MPTEPRPRLSKITPTWLTRALAGNPVYAGCIVRSFHYEEVAAGPGMRGTVACFHLNFADATKGEVTLPESPATSPDRSEG